MNITSLSVIVPVYGSAMILSDLVKRLEPVLAVFEDQRELIFVCDDSPDNAWEVIKELREQHDWVRGIRLMRNFGQHGALLCGIRAARFDTICTMDDDLQHPPEVLPLLWEGLTADTDVVYGPPEHEQHGLFRDLASRITKLVLQSAMGAESARNVSALRVFRTDIRKAFIQFQGPQPNIDVLLTWGTRRFKAVRVRHDARASGESNYTLSALIRHAMNMMTGFSTLPLQIASLLGFVCTGLGLLILMWVLGRLLISGSAVPGFPFLASTIAIFSGAQLFALGIIGEYLARMHFRMLDRPAYVEASDE